MSNRNTSWNCKPQKLSKWSQYREAIKVIGYPVISSWSWINLIFLCCNSIFPTDDGRDNPGPERQQSSPGELGVLAVRANFNKTKYFPTEGQQFSELMEACDLIKTVSREASEVVSLLPGLVNYLLGTKIEER